MLLNTKHHLRWKWHCGGNDFHNNNENTLNNRCILWCMHASCDACMHPVMHPAHVTFVDIVKTFSIICSSFTLLVAIRFVFWNHNWKTLSVRLHVHFTRCSVWYFACIRCSVSVETVFSLWCLLSWTWTHRHVTCPRPDTSAACSAGSGSGWCGQSDSSSDAGMSTQHCSADSSWRNPTGPREGQREGWLTHAGLNGKDF